MTQIIFYNFAKETKKKSEDYMIHKKLVENLSPKLGIRSEHGTNEALFTFVIIQCDMDVCFLY